MLYLQSLVSELIFFFGGYSWRGHWFLGARRIHLNEKTAQTQTKPNKPEYLSCLVEKLPFKLLKLLQLCGEKQVIEKQDQSEGEEQEGPDHAPLTEVRPSSKAPPLYNCRNMSD